MNYRQQLYQKYFETQAGRNIEQIKQQLDDDFKQLNRDVAPFLPPTKTAKILDIGCGYGNLLLWLKERGYNNVAGVDISPEQVEVAHSLGLNEVVCGNVFEFLENNEGKFDTVVGMDIIEHFTKNELLKLLHLIKKSLKKGGNVIFRTPNMDSPMGTYYAFGDYTHEILLNTPSAYQIMKVAQFSDVQVLSSIKLSSNFIKRTLQKVMWWKIVLFIKIIFFATDRTSKGLIFTPNLIITGKKK